ncbi:unannotated protein [freshwater metagenome]|uniref:Unannotated protein n=1 Tax=freshwater metagenome TaxID=449393 RepID=A0A6J7IGQ6_9ZZZZ
MTWETIEAFDKIDQVIEIATSGELSETRTAHLG